MTPAQRRHAVNFEIFIPIVLFLTIAYIVKAILDSRVRRKLVESAASEDLVRSLLEADDQARRTSALKWGLVLVSIGAAFGLIELVNLASDSPGTFGLIFFAAGVGMLAYHGLAQRKR